MKKKFLNYAAVAVILFLGACSNQDEILTDKDIDSERTITLTATMPDEPTTYVALTPDAKNIKLTWQVGDRLQFAIVQGSIKETRILPLKANNISPNGKTVNFTIALPSSFVQSADFDLYGLYSFVSTNELEGGLSSADPTNVILTKTPGSRFTLENVQGRGDVMLYFKEAGINLANLPESVKFKHLGSLFSVSLRNLSGAPLLLTDRKLSLRGDGGGTDANWAYNTGAGGKIFDLVSEEFQDKGSAINNISFDLPALNLANASTGTLWAWFPPLPDKVWPKLKLELLNSDQTVFSTSINTKPARTAPTAAGKTYHFYATWDGTNLVFTNDTFTTPTPAIN